MKKYTPITVIALLFFTNCNFAQQANVLNANDFEKKILSEKNIQLIDVRTPEEFQQGYIKGAKNINIYSSTFEQEINKLDKTKPVYIYCRSGNRSKSAAQILSKNGFKTIYDLQGGIGAWQSNNKPLAK
ncbi:MAG: rhodanese-like domain-containing protein [Bacteroidia bacterium]